MAIVFSSSSGDAPGFVAVSTHAHTIAGNKPILFVHTNFVSGVPRNVSTLTYSGVGMTLLVTNSFIDAGNLQIQEVWYLVGPPVGANNIIATWLGNGEITVAGISWTGVDPDNPLGTHGTASSPSANSISKVINSEVDELVVDFVAVKNIPIGGAVNVGAGQTQRASLYSNEVATSNRHRVKSSEEAGAAAVTMSWSGWVALACGIIGVPLKPFVPFVVRPVEYTLDVWDPEQRILDSAGHEVPRYKIKPNKWCRIVGLESTTAIVYENNYEDPTLVYFESVSYDGETDEVQIITNRGDLPEVIMARLASGSTG